MNSREAAEEADTLTMSWTPDCESTSRTGSRHPAPKATVPADSQDGVPYRGWPCPPHSGNGGRRPRGRFPGKGIRRGHGA